ncbi:ATP-binding protein [Streptomyces rishiriensis]|uniref:Anti-sigma regulatory factor (Ser/Thr protein kinase) n=1 Tax=Streptomyces rishiriensis TaxID=68264 RepID=A0ABU0NNX0_STRRH|nr:ATP-binding protein [Streptomyces rishiriensis]MDQ0580800.1 anti-sigma regulatory factor (Ser/Thr protein kinase) [Streptomyces rishiriensis]
MTARPGLRPPVTVRVFTQRLSATPRGARLARRLAQNQLHAWGIPYGAEVSDTVAVIVGELAANAVTHGRVPGRDFELRLSFPPGSVRVEVTDTRSGPRPPGPGAVPAPHPLGEAGRGLLLVDALAARWEVLDREPPPGKTVRAEVDVPNWLVLARRLSLSEGAALRTALRHADRTPP